MNQNRRLVKAKGEQKMKFRSVHKVSRLCMIGAIVVLLFICAISLTGCTEVTTASQSVSEAADNFKVCRRITVFNLRTDTILYEFEGYSSIHEDSTDGQLEITSCTGKGEYKKDFIKLADEVTYIVQDLGGNEYEPFHYRWTIRPYGIDVHIGNDD